MSNHDAALPSVAGDDDGGMAATATTIEVDVGVGVGVDGGGGGVGDGNDDAPSSSSPSSSSTKTSSPATDDDVAPPSSRRTRFVDKVSSIYDKNSFLILVIFAILLSYAYPPLGATYLYPDVTSDWLAVVLIFVLSGMGIRTEEFGKAFQRLYFNAFVQLYNFGIVSGLVYGMSRLMLYVGALPNSLADGMVICSCLPLTVSMVMVLTRSSNGDVASAVFHAAFGNVIGVFLSPALIALYLGISGNVDLGTITIKLVLRVLVPLLVGQFLRCFVPMARNFVDDNSKFFKKFQEWILVFIVYTVFCETFESGMDATFGQICIMIALQGGMLIFVMGLAWSILVMLFRNEPRLIAMGLFGCTHKTVAMGIPLINSMYSDINPSLVGLYTLPLLIWHPMQLLIGTAVAPRIAEYVDRREGVLMSGLSELGPLRDDDDGDGARDVPSTLFSSYGVRKKRGRLAEEDGEIIAAIPAAAHRV
jgi:sodium/bile acid cotransporter 7